MNASGYIQLYTVINGLKLFRNAHIRDTTKARELIAFIAFPYGQRKQGVDLRDKKLL